VKSINYDVTYHATSFSNLSLPLCYRKTQRDEENLINYKVSNT